MSKSIFAVFALAAAMAAPANADWSVTGGSVGITINGQSGAYAEGAQTYTGVNGWGQANLDYQTPVGNLTGSSGFEYGAQNWANGPSQAGGGGFGTLTGSWFNTNSPCGISPCGGQGH